jgi:hypothetical protein
MKVSKRVMSTLALFVGAASLASASPIVLPVYSPSLDPTETFGTPLSGTSNPAVIVSLSSLASYLIPGYTIAFNAVGSVCFNPGVQSCSSASAANEMSVSSLTNPIIGGFVGAGGLGGGFISTSLSLSGPQQTSVGNDWSSVIANTFIVTSAGTGNITIPVGATGVVFVFLDQMYSDNSDFSHTLNVDATFTAPIVGTPEPATYGMMLAGLGGLVAFKRLRRS